MQRTFDFAEDIALAQIRDALTLAFGRPKVGSMPDPVDQLVKSLISGRTRDEVSLPAFERLARAYPRWAEMAAATAHEIESVIADVTFADVKAVHLKRTLQIVQASHPDFRLDFLGGLTVLQALEWLERLPGVGRKVAAATLNFSTLFMPAFVIDTHILRVLKRLGLVRPKGTTQNAYDVVMAAAEWWSATDLAEFHSLMKRLGRTICRYERPICSQCPIETHCKLSAHIGRAVKSAGLGQGLSTSS